jgi:hypothetical protein
MLLSLKITMIRSRWRTYMRRTAFLLIVMSLLWLQPGAAAPAGNPDDTVGPYRLIFKGCYSGLGTAVVTPKFVMIRGDLVDDNGNQVNFVAQRLMLENHRFHDRVTVGGTTVIINGRVDPSGGALRKARLNCTFTAKGAGFGRVVGDHK